MWTDELPPAEAVAYAAGIGQILELLAERVAELDAVWRPAPRRSWSDQVAERVALFEACAERQPGSTWRGRYPGGPVEFETGRLRHRIGVAA